MSSAPCGLYLISPPTIESPAAFAAAFAGALKGGEVSCMQLRLKDADDDAILYAAEALLPIAAAHEVAFLINDRPDLAYRAGADGVHIGQQDAPYRKARAILGDEATIGVTCHNSRHLALEAGEAGADYVAFGAFFPSETKDAPTRADLAILDWWTYATTVPCVAIGGITPDNCRRIADAGADFIAVSGAVWHHPDGPARAVKAFHEALES